MTQSARSSQLDYFMRELHSFRQEAPAFARDFPKVAAALEFGQEGEGDPQVERLIEAFAFMAARLRRNMDQQLPRLASGMLGSLYPHLTAPIPSMGVIELRVDPKRARDTLRGFTIPRGAEVLCDTDIGVTCRFRTAWQVQLWPLEVAAIDTPRANEFSFLRESLRDAPIFRIRLRAIGGQLVSDTTLDRLRFKIGGAGRDVATLYEQLLNNSLEVWAGDPLAKEKQAGEAAGNKVFRKLSPDALRSVGFAQDEALLPQPATAHHGHRLIREYFTLPQKFHFIDVADLGPAASASGEALDIVFVLAEGTSPRPEKVELVLGGVPVVNLFSRTSEPMRIDGASTEHVIVPDHRLERSIEVHSIEEVTLTAADAPDKIIVTPYFSYNHEDNKRKRAAWWTSRRRATRRPDIAGSDVLISFRDEAFSPEKPQSNVAFARLLCTNRGLAEKTTLNAIIRYEANAPLKDIRWAQRPTAQIPAPEVDTDLWRLVSHLSVNQLSFGAGPAALEALKEHLKLYCGKDSASARKQIAGITSIAAERITRRIGEEGWRGFCRGSAVTVELERDNFPEQDGFLFGALLARFLALYAGANDFVELHLRQNNGEEEWASWPPMTGEQILI